MKEGRRAVTKQIWNNEVPITTAVGMPIPAFFRRLFKRCTSLTPGEYCRMFRPFATAADIPAPVEPAAA